MLQLEKAYLLCNAWPSKATTSIYNTEKGNIEKQEIELTWNCFVIDGPEVDMRALQILAYINEQNAVSNAVTYGSTKNSAGVSLDVGQIDDDHIVHLESDGGAVEFSNMSNAVDGFSYKIVNDTTKDQGLAGYVENVGTNV